MTKLYLVKRTDNVRWDEYDSFVCCAEDEDEARKIHPNGTMCFKKDMSDDYREYFTGAWTDKIETLEVTCIGIANLSLRNRQVICASYNAG